MNKLSERQIGYLAAMIDGEGYIGITNSKTKYGKNSYIGRVCVTNTNKTLLIWCRDTTGLGVIYPRPTSISNHKDSYCWELRIREIAEFLTLIQSSLIIKWEQADYLLEYLKLEKFKNNHNQVTEEVWFQRKIFFEILGELNKKGL